MKILIVKRGSLGEILRSKLIGRKREFGENDTVFAVRTIEDAERLLRTEDIRLLIIGLNLSPESTEKSDVFSGWRWVCESVLPEYPHLAHRIIVFSSHINAFNTTRHSEVEESDIVCAPPAETYRDVLQNKNAIDELIRRIFEIHEEIQSMG